MLPVSSPGYGQSLCLAAILKCRVQPSTATLVRFKRLVFHTRPNLLPAFLQRREPNAKQLVMYHGQIQIGLQ
jgi:hypothetical protein